MDASEIPKAYTTALEHHQAGRLTDAEAIYRQILALHPEIVEVRNNLAITLADTGRATEAIAEYRQLLSLRPAFPEAWNNLGNALRQAGDIDGAIDAFTRAISLSSTFTTALRNLGLAQLDLFRPDLAAATFRRLVELTPIDPLTHFNIANAVYDLAQLDPAIDAYHIAIQLRPDFMEAHHNLARPLKDSGRLDEALASLHSANELTPNAFTGSTILCTAHFHPDYDAKRLYQMHADWNRDYAAPLAPPSIDFPNVPDPDRRLRIGYVSPDFREHPVGRFFLPLVSHHDRAQFEIICYAHIPRPDALTRSIKSHADIWQSTLGLTDEQLATLIRQDRIDVLIDLTMHMQGSRLLTFARKPAPVQVTYLAYCSTTGLSAIDYRISDPWLDPPGRDETVYSEKTFRLPRTYWCYSAPESSPPIAPPPSRSTGHVTFGCLNNYCKVTSITLELWRKLMRQVPHSRLLLHSLEGRHRQIALDYFAAADVSPGRIEFVGQLPLVQYLETYNRIDIALDPFPYGGGTTTCDALWMGVPVITLTGDTAVSRGGSSILHNLNHPELIASTADQYLQIATSLANDPTRLATYRSTLRGQMQSASLMGAPTFARDFEATLRSMWRSWCASRVTNSVAAQPPSA